MVWVATRRGFSIASLVAQPLELSCGFNTISTYSSHQHLLRGDSEACVHTGQEAFKGFVKAGWVEGAQASLLMWVPYHFPWRQDWRVGKGDVKWPHLYTHTQMTPYIYGGVSSLHKLFWLLSSLAPSLQAVSSQPTAVSSLVCSPNPTFQHPSPAAPGDARLRLGCAGLQQRAYI